MDIILIIILVILAYFFLKPGVKALKKYFSRRKIFGEFSRKIKNAESVDDNIITVLSDYDKFRDDDVSEPCFKNEDSGEVIGNKVVNAKVKPNEMVKGKIKYFFEQHALNLEEKLILPCEVFNQVDPYRLGEFLVVLLFEERRSKIWDDIAASVKFNAKHNPKALETIEEGACSTQSYLSRLVFGARAIDDKLATKLARLVLEPVI